jgi:hypothetical protein
MKNQQMSHYAQSELAEKTIHPYEINAKERVRQYKENGSIIANKILSVMIAISGIVVIPIQFISTGVLGLVFSVPLIGAIGLLILSFIWIGLLLTPIYCLSYLYDKVAFLRPILATIGVPFAFIGNVFTACIPSMGEMESRFSKMVICQTFPYTWRYLQVERNKLVIENDDVLTKVLREVSGAEPLKNYLDKLRIDIISRPEYIKNGYKLDW